MAKKKVISVANDANDDWLKKIDNGKWQKQDLKAHADAAKKGPKGGKPLIDVFDGDDGENEDIPGF